MNFVSSASIISYKLVNIWLDLLGENKILKASISLKKLNFDKSSWYNKILEHPEF